MAHNSDTVPKKPRRFLAQPIETISRSSRDNEHSPNHPGQWPPSQFKKENIDGGPNSDVHHLVRPFEHPQLPPGMGEPSHQPELADVYDTGLKESSQKAAKNSRPETGVVQAKVSATRLENNNFDEDTPVKQCRPRKFTPQLMETARHSFRRERRPLTADRIIKRTNTLNDISSITASNSIHESRFSYSSILRRQESRRHSFRVPDLPAIPSSCSEASDNSEPPPTAYPMSAIRLSRNERSDDAFDPYFSEYNLPIPVHSSESQLKEQALAAFPNEQVYQPVDHFAIDREEDDAYLEEPITYIEKYSPRTYRRASSADLSWELEHMRRHKEGMRMDGRHVTPTNSSQISHATLRAANNMDRLVNPKGLDRDRDLGRVHSTNRPPMLGSDLIFPQSLTPETTICEGPDGIDPNTECRQSFCGFPGLWSANPRPTDKHNGGGLWMGTCKGDLCNPKSSRFLLPGILTPIHDTWKPSSDDCTAGAQNRLTCYTISQSSDLYNLKQERTRKEEEEEDNLEFDDGFVTQIYNYLSLGYPSVARYYDHELSKVSGVSIATLRGDGLNTDATGHVSVWDTSVGGGMGESVCMRWVALRLYIHEWARQQPRMMEEDSDHGTWGVRERKGSWAI